MTTATIQLYEYSDLIKPENSKVLEKVVNNWHDSGEFYYEELKDCIKQFCKDFGFKTGRRYSDISFYMENEVEGQRLRTWIINNFDLWQRKIFYKKWKKQRRSKIFVERTEGNGICYYMDLISVIFDFLKNPTDMDDLCNDLGDKISKMFDDIESWTSSEEYILEAIEANGYKFTSQGKMY